MLKLKKTPAACRDLADLIVFLCGFFRQGEREKPACDGSVCPPALRKPDPFIYCQYYLMSLGYPVTWDNPDIFIFDGATLTDPHSLQPATTYTVAARIWNSSADTPVASLRVTFSYLSFGIAVRPNPIGSTTTDLNAKGLPGCPAFAYMAWTTPATPGHYCLQVLLEPPDDLNWLNNLGQRNTDVGHAASPANFTFAVGNPDTALPSTVTFTVDTYSIPPLPQCDEREPGRTGARPIPGTAPAVPPDWSVAITPSELHLAAGEEATVQAAITPPPAFIGTMPFNITARTDIRPIGGVTVYVEVP